METRKYRDLQGETQRYRDLRVDPEIEPGLGETQTEQLTSQETKTLDIFIICYSYFSYLEILFHNVKNLDPLFGGINGTKAG